MMGTEERKAGAPSDREKGKTATRVQGSVWHDGNARFDVDVM